MDSFIKHSKWKSSGAVIFSVSVVAVTQSNQFTWKTQENPTYIKHQKNLDMAAE